MPIPTEPIGSIPRPPELIEAMAAGNVPDELYDAAVQDTVTRFEATGSPVITDGEQRKPSFATYPIHGSPIVEAGGVTIPFADGHTRQLPKLVARPFRYQTYAGTYIAEAKHFATRPFKQAVISASALSLLYPEEGIEGYSREEFLDDLVAEAELDVRSCLANDAVAVQIDFTEARLSLKLDPSGGLLKQFVELNNAVLDRLSDDERSRVGVHTCPGGDQNSTHSADVDYAGLLPTLFKLKVTNFYVALASESDRPRVLGIIRDNLSPGQRVFVGVIDPIDMRVETPAEVRDRVLEAAEHIPIAQLGTTDDCGFSPFGDDASTARDIAFAKIAARVEGTRLAEQQLGV